MSRAPPLRPGSTIWKLKMKYLVGQFHRASDAEKWINRRAEDGYCVFQVIAYPLPPEAVRITESNAGLYVVMQKPVS